jgi:hypothetical protein
MKIVKKGLIFAPDKKKWWQQYYAMMPTPYLIDSQNIIRIFYGTTDSEKFGRTSYIDLDADNPSKIIYQSDHYILDIGKDGYFDDCGAVPSSVLKAGENYFLYYVGFQRCTKVPYMLFSGLAIGNGEKFEKYSSAPIIDRTRHNSISNAAPFVLKDGEIYRMWFWKGEEWTTIKQKQYIKAVICQATSADGIYWEINYQPCIELDEKKEFSVGRPWVIVVNGIYKMFYSVRYIDKLYRIGYAESIDGINWIRKDNEIDIDVSQEGWDSEMICYPSVISVKEKTYLFYNGNNNGETGFGYAEILEW